MKIWAIIMPVSLAANVTFLCKCSCLSINRFAVENCASCTMEQCDLKFKNCKNGYRLLLTGRIDNGFESQCFQRGSLKDEIIVIGFLIWSGGFIFYMLAKLLYSKLQDIGVARRQSIMLQEEDDMIPLQEPETHLD